MNKRKSEIRVLQEWKGIIENFDDFYINVHLTDLTNGGTDEEASFTWFDIDDKDEDRVEIGATFHWIITLEGSTPKSKIIFDRFKKRTDKEIAEAYKRASELNNIFNKENDGTID